MEFFDKILVLDGAMGTELVKKTENLGKIPEELNITNPDIVKSVHKSYVDAGADMIYTCSFGANAYKCKDSKYSVEELVTAAVKNAREVAEPKNVKTALSMGTIGDIIEPFGNLKFDRAYEIYKEMVVAGMKAGVDALVFETQTDLLEVKAGVLAARENTNLPIMVTMTFEANGRTFTGTSVESMGITLEALGVKAVGVNCSLGPNELLPLVKRLRSVTSLPIIVKPNAGLPDPMTGKYSMSPEEFASSMIPFLEMGVSMVGGCCGTSPEFIEKLAAVASTYKPCKPSKITNSFLCSGREFVDVKNVHVVGERINPTGKKLFKEALLNHDLDYIKNQALQQVEAGAEILDVNVGLPGIDEVSMMQEVVKELQAIVSTPLQIDSSNPEAIEAALRVYNGKALVNSVNGEAEVMDKILPLVVKYGASVIGLTMDKEGVPSSWESRVKIADRIIEKCHSYGIEDKDIYIDCLTLTVSAQQKECRDTLTAIREVKKKHDVHTVLGVSNISFGLPRRELINTTFLTMAMEAGLNLPIINPNNEAMMGAVDAFLVLNNVDVKSEKYVAKYAKPAEESDSKAGVAAFGTDATGKQNAASDESVASYIRKGLADNTARAVREILKTKEPLDVVNEELIPALDKVGADFEKGTLFLPQLLSAAMAAEAGFTVIKEQMAANNQETISKGTIVLATVEGDVHDIGKNIVKTILENYGFKVIDLGKDVAPMKVVEAAREYDVRLVGLSALMTTTVVSMEKTIKAIREAGLNCKVMVGGAVLTEDYAHKIGADYYSKDAKQSADIAKSVYGDRG